MGRITAIDTSAAPVSALDGLLRFEMYAAGPGRAAPNVEHQHCLIIPVQEAPIRTVSTRDGVANRFTLFPGDIALAPQGSGTVWEWRDPARVVLIWIDADAMRRFVEIEMRLLIEGCQLDDERVITDPDLAAAAIRLHEACIEPGPGAAMLCDAHARVFLVTLIRHHALQPKGEIRQVVIGINQPVFDRVVTHIEARMAQKITPRDLARVAGMSEAVFARKFKTQTGQTPMGFVREMRLSHARDLLGSPDLSLGQIAVQCGFADQAHFSRVFRAGFGQTPLKFRKALLQA